MTRCAECERIIDAEWDVCPECGATVPGDAGDADDGTLYGRVATMAAGVLLLVGAWLPWYSATVFGRVVTIDGVITGGWLTAAFGSVLLLLTIRWNPYTRAVSVFVGVLTCFVVGAFLIDPFLLVNPAQADISENQLNRARAVLSADYGLFVTLAAGVLGAAGGMYHRVEGASGDHVAVEKYRPADFEAGRSRAVAEAIDEHGVANQDTIVREVYVEYSEGYSDREDWWTDVEAELREDDRVNDTGRGWTLSKK